LRQIRHPATLAIVRDGGTLGAWVGATAPVRHLMPVLLTDSPKLVKVAAIDPGAIGAGTAVLLEPPLHQSWEEMFAAHGGALDYLLAPGNYEAWGQLRIPTSLDPAGGRRRTIRYFNPGVDDQYHPVQRSRHAWVESLRLEGEHTQNWVVHGLTVFRPEYECTIQNGAGNITIDFCLIEHPRMRGVRVRNVSHCTIQRCVIRNSVNTSDTGDTTGIQVRQHTAPEMVDINIIDNEIYNVGDGIQLTAHGVEPLRPVEVLIEGNDIYLEPSRYLGDSNTTWDENGIDIKVGSDRPESTIVRTNRLWGFRLRKGASHGELLVVQMFCRNLVVEGNIMGDAPRGMKDEIWPEDSGIDALKPRNVVFRNNQFYEIRDRAEDDVGAITKPITTGIRFERNWFARSDFLADATPPRYKGQPVFEHNTRVEVPEPFQRLYINRDGDEVESVDKVPYPEPTNRHLVARMGYDTYERKRWTCRERVIGAIPAGPPVTHGPPDDPLHG
jgi:hypothetical protein